MKFIKDLLRQWSCLQDFKTTTSDLQPLTISLVGYCTRLSEEENWIKVLQMTPMGFHLGQLLTYNLLISVYKQFNSTLFSQNFLLSHQNSLTKVDNKAHYNVQKLWIWIVTQLSNKVRFFFKMCQKCWILCLQHWLWNFTRGKV